CRMPLLPHTKGHIEVRLGRTRYGVYLRRHLSVDRLGHFQLFIHERFIYVPRNFVCPHPKWIQFHLMYGFFVVFLSLITSHHELTFWNCFHRKCKIGPVELLNIALMPGLCRGKKVSYEQ